jgi:hypothetical protein
MEQDGPPQDDRRLHDGVSGSGEGGAGVPAPPDRRIRLPDEAPLAAPFPRAVTLPERATAMLASDR